METKSLIKEFISYLNRNGYSGLQIDKWPDEENRNCPDIDAIADVLAIEHTSIDTLPNQRRDSNWFSRIVQGLEDEISYQLSFSLRIIFPYDGIQTGQNWSQIRDALRLWIITVAPTLQNGRHTVRGQMNFPFDFLVHKASDQTPRLSFGRFAPEDKSLPLRIREQLDRKINKLKPYKEKGRITILLIETSDIALMNEDILLQAIKDGYEGIFPESVDQVWYADTSIPSASEFIDFTDRLKS
jgi:hypothetical protein